MADRLEKQEYCPGGTVSPKKIDGIGDIDIEFCAKGNKGAETDISADGVFKKGSGEDTAFGNKTDIAIPGNQREETGIEIDGRSDKTERVGPQDTAAIESR
jgi:hypothetical protein